MNRPRLPLLERWHAALDRRRWLPFVLPLAVFLLAGAFEPTAKQPGGAALGLAIPYAAYPLVYALKIALTTVAILLVAPAWRAFALRVSPLAFVVGALGVVVWVGLCALRLEARLFDLLGSGGNLGARAGFDPFAHWPDRPGMAWSFFALRVFGLAVVVPLAEEFFLRGLIVRVIVDPEWWKVRVGQLTPLAAAVAVALPVSMHPQEALAAAAWFGLVTWLAHRTGSIWDCVAAHVTTNALLAAWVLVSGQWWYL